MKGSIEPWVMLTLLALAGCATTPEGMLGSAPGPSTSAATTVGSEADTAVSGVAVVAADDLDSTSPALPEYYSADQAARGEGFFRETCLECHSSSEFRGRAFERQWRGRTVRDLYASIAFSMPDDNPGGLPAQTYTDIIAYVLELNGYPSGAAELITDRDTMRAQSLWPEVQTGR